MKNIKSARIVGVLQDWDLYDYRYDIERVNVDVPLGELSQASEDVIAEMVDEGYGGGGYDDSPLGDLVAVGIEAGWFTWKSHWEWEDPCEFELEIEWEED